MNYRHAFHAGNHADVFKHAALTLVLEHLRQKPAPFAVLDTHAGVGVYDLTSDAARKTREAEEGANMVFGRPLASAPAYAELLSAMNPEGLATRRVDGPTTASSTGSRRRRATRRWSSCTATARPNRCDSR